MTHRKLSFLTAAATMAICAPAFAQQITGSIVGTVTDSSGAAVPNATVTITNPSTGYSRTVTANGNGEYNVPEIPAGTYKVAITAPNFKSFVTNDVIVNVATSNTVNGTLSVGDTSETVTVTDTAVQVDTSTGALGQVIDGTQVKELPLNGRSFVELTQLQPGVSAANGFDTKNKGLQGGVDMSVNGNPTTNNLFLIDGVNNNDTGSNRTILIYPSNEAIAEFKMLTNSYGAEYGQASGAVISIITRSGTNKFHGSVFYDGRNDVLNAFTYFARQNANPALPRGGKDKLRRNDFGYSIGGPIKRDKLFFFFSEEWNREIRGRVVSACVPTALELSGDFSQPSCGNVFTNGGTTNPVNIPQQLQAPGNRYKLNALSPTAQTILQLYPAATSATPNAQGNNWSQSLPTALYWREENVRIDYRATPKNLFVGRYTQDSWSNPAYNAGYWGDDPFPALNSSWAQPSKSMMGRWTATISNTLVNDVAFQYSNNRINITPGGTNPGLLPQVSSAIPTLYPNSLKHSSVGVPQVNLGGYGGTLQNIAPWQNQLDLYSAQDNASKIFGRNVLKFGVSLDWDGKDEDTGPASSERPAVNTGNTNIGPGGFAVSNNLANFLIPNNIFLINETSTNVRAQLRWRDYEFYVTDNFKLTPRLTIDAGVRYSIMPPTYQPNGQETNFQPSAYSAARPASDACNGLIIVPGTDPCGAANRQFGTTFSSGTPGPNKYLQNVNYHLIAPRVGVNWDVSGGGKTVVSAAGGQFYQRERVSRYTLVSNAPFALNASNYARTLGGATPATLTGVTTSPAGGFDLRNILPNSWQWNLTVQQALGSNSLFSISYVGNKGTHLTSSYDINQIPQQNWLPASFAVGNDINTYRPFSNYGTLAWWTHDGNSNFHGLETLLKTRLKNLQFLAAYTWSHSIADIVVDDSSGGLGSQTRTYYPNPRLDRGNGDVNRPNNFVANAIYTAPLLRGKGPLVEGVLGGWELSGIVTAADGNSFTIYQGGVSDANSAGTLNSLFQTGYNAPQRPLRVPGVSPIAGRKGAQIVNPAAFTLVGYQIGTISPLTAPRGYVGGPNYNNTDFSLDKNWHVHELATIQFRLDFFNLWNHANFNPSSGSFTPFSTVTCGNAPCSVTNNTITAQTYSSGFGASNAVIGGNASRQIQYTLHVNF